MARMDLVTFAESDSMSNETSGRPIPRQRYQRKVRVTYTRAEAQLIQALILKAATDQDLAALFVEPGNGIKTIMHRFKNAWKKLDRQIRKRDEAQQRKELVDQDPEPVDDGEKDVPLF